MELRIIGRSGGGGQKMERYNPKRRISMLEWISSNVPIVGLRAWNGG
jgi:hypothetical protein